jgi:ribosomal protein L2
MMLQSRFRPLAAGAASLPSLCQTVLRLNTIRRYATDLQSDAKKTSIQDAPTFGPPSTEIQAVKMRTYKPRTPGLRHLKRPINDHLWKGRPYLPLTFPKKGHGKGGRNNTGRITIRHRGGGAKRRIRTVDFKRWTPGPHTVERIEYDPGRSAHIALLTEQATGNKSYIVAAEGMRAGDVVQSYRAGIPQDLLDSMGGVIDPGILAAKTAWRGNCLPMHMIPVGTVVYNVGSRSDGKAVFCRSAGTYATVISKEEETQADGTKVMTGKHVIVRLQSGEIRKVSKDACATIGVSSNIMHQYRQLGKAGRSRWLNIRPTVRGLAMNASMWPSVSFPCCSRGSFVWPLTCTQTTILTVVAVVNQRVTGTPSVHGASRQRAASRRAPRAMSTSGWSLPGYGTWVSGETRTRPSEGGRCAGERANTSCTLCRSAIFVFLGRTMAASCARDFEREPLLQTCQACCRWSERHGLDDPTSAALQRHSQHLLKSPFFVTSPGI